MSEDRRPDPLLDPLVEQFETAERGESHGQDVVYVDRADLLAFALAARDAGFETCADVTAVDWFRHRQIRFELVVSILSMRHRRRLRLLAPVPADDPTAPSLVGVWPGASFGERETYDMFGIVFTNSPDPSRILMPDDWEGHPLRKDYSVGAVPVQFKDNHKAT